MSQEQRTPDELDAENALICEKLLGWEKDGYEDRPGWYWVVPFKLCSLTSHLKQTTTPSFTTWADAGLILDALRCQGIEITFATLPDDWWCEIAEGPQSNGDTGPLAIRAAVLEYIRRLP